MPRMISPWAPKISGSALPTSSICTCAEATVWVTGLHPFLCPQSGRAQPLCEEEERERENDPHHREKQMCRDKEGRGKKESERIKRRGK
jgi:hypothetical protein